MEKNSIKNRKDIVSEIFNFIAAWLEQAIVSSSPHTVEAYKYAMDLYVRFLEESLHVGTKSMAWECFSRENIEKWMKWLTGRGNKPQTVNLRLSHIREFLRYMEGRSPATYGHLYHRAASIKRMKVQHTEVKGVTDAAVEAVLKAIDTSTDAGARDFTLTLFLGETGARLNEALSVRMKDIHTDTSGKVAVTVIGKGGYVRTLYLTPVLATKLKEYILRFHGETSAPEAYLFFSKIKGTHEKTTARAIQKRMKELAAKAHETCEEVPLDLHPHNYRHAYGTRRIRQGKQLAVVQREMGHRNIQSTMTYIDTTSMMEQAQEAAESEEVRKIKPIWNQGNSLVAMYRSRFMT
jgi:site-specific recombinase XerD